MTAPAIDAVGLGKEYGGRAVLRDLTLTVQPGEVFGFLGPNGAGKTTAVKLLLGLARPTSGEARLFGVPSTQPAARRVVGYLPETFRFHDWMTGRQLLDFHADLAGVSHTDRAGRAANALARVGLAERGGERIRGYSKGMTQRLGIAQALVGDPRLVVLDEPTSALDPIGRRDIRDLIRALRGEGVAVFLNSHLLTEIEMVCDRVAVIDQGRVLYTGSLDALIGAGREIEISVAPVDPRLVAIVADLADVIRVEASSIVVRVQSEQSGARLAAAIVAAEYELRAFVPRTRSLEDAFVDLIRRARES
ncbi:MAG: ABC transporter ATP-binding protein [Chloroflexota bacterium]|nr:MAG: ABC transporter ATP-binding protein [Chloroflexota bacterium]